MLAVFNVDAVVVCTPPGSHADIGMDVLRAGKHLIVEKPLARTVAEARRLVREAAKHPQLMVSGCSCRHARLQPKFPYIKQLIDLGKVGEVYFIHHRCMGRQGRPGIEYHPTAKWFLDRDNAGGGPLYDWGVYDLSFHLGILGESEFKSCEAFGINGLDRVPAGTETFNVEEHGGALMTFQNGLRYFWERASNAHQEGAAPDQHLLHLDARVQRCDFHQEFSQGVRIHAVLVRRPSPRISVLIGAWTDGTSSASALQAAEVPDPVEGDVVGVVVVGGAIIGRAQGEDDSGTIELSAGVLKSGELCRFLR